MSKYLENRSLKGGSMKKNIHGFTRAVVVNRNRSPKQVLDAVPHILCEDSQVGVIQNMPCGTGKTIEITFFKPGRSMGDDELEKEYELRGLKPADPYSLAAVNENYPTLIDKHPNGTHWKNKDGKWCYMCLTWTVTDPFVQVRRANKGKSWSDAYWFAGIRK